MNQTSEVPVRTTLQMWQGHQRTDGRLVGAMVIAAAIATLCFALSPSPATAWVMGIFLFALGLASLRLLNSTMMVIRSRSHLSPSYATEIVDGQILDVYEHPVAPGAPITQRTSTFWLASPAEHPIADSQAALPPQHLPPGQESRFRVQDRGQQ